MRKKLTAVSTQAVLERVLEGLKQELIEAADEEIALAAQELRMNLALRESAAFAGLTYPARPQLSDFFELEAFRQMRLEDEREFRSDHAKTLRAGPPRQTRTRRMKRREQSETERISKQARPSTPAWAIAGACSG